MQGCTISGKEFFKILANIACIIQASTELRQYNKIKVTQSVLR